MVPSAWATLGVVGVAIAAETVASTVQLEPRTIENLPSLAWWFLIGWSFAGWVIASLKPAVIAMNDPTQVRSVVWAGILSTFTASLAFGIACGLYLLCEARWDHKPLAALYGYLGALGGGFWGMKGMEFAIGILTSVIEGWARARGKQP